MYSESELIKHLQEKNEAAFDYLYENYSGALGLTVSKIITDKGIAEDVLQETFMLIWKNIGQYEKSKGRLFTWMQVIARNLSIDMVRSKAFKNLAKLQEIDVAYLHQHDVNSRTKFDAMGVKNKLKLLRPEYIKLIDMAYFFGYTHDEISKKLNIPKGTVKTKLRGAIVELRKIFDEPAA